jgi:hypothetical protein
VAHGAAVGGTAALFNFEFKERPMIGNSGANKECNCASCVLGARLGISREIMHAVSHVAVAVKLVRAGLLAEASVDALVVKSLAQPDSPAAFAAEIQKVLQSLAGVNGPVQVVPIFAVAQPAAAPPAAVPWPEWAMKASNN